ECRRESDPRCKVAVRRAAFRGVEGDLLERRQHRLLYQLGDLGGAERTVTSAACGLDALVHAAPVDHRRPALRAADEPCDRVRSLRRPASGLVEVPCLLSRVEDVGDLLPSFLILLLGPRCFHLLLRGLRATLIRPDWPILAR